MKTEDNFEALVRLLIIAVAAILMGVWIAYQ